MYFTQDDYRKIEEWLFHRTVKDSEFPLANPLSGTETFPILQDKKNKIIKFGDFIKQVSEMEVHDIYNVSALHNAYDISRKEAIALVPEWKRKRGLVITYRSNALDTETTTVPGYWVIEQFIGSTLDDWNKDIFWDDVVLRWFDRFIGQANGIAPLDENSLVPLDYIPDIPKSKVGLSNVTNDAQVKRSEMGAANGVATLNDSGTVPSTQLPSYVDDVLEYDTLSSLPAVGEMGKIYVTKDTNLTYRWTGSQYTEISKSLALGETNSTAYRGDLGKANSLTIESLPSSITEGLSYSNTENEVTLYEAHSIKDSDNVYHPAASDASMKFPTVSTTKAGVMTASDKKLLDSTPEYIGTGEIAVRRNDTDVIIDVTRVRKGTNNTYEEANKGHLPIPPATSEVAGTMSANDKRLSSSLPEVILTSVSFNSFSDYVRLNYSFVNKVNSVYTRNNSHDTLGAATSEWAGVMSSSDKAKLMGIEEGAQVNSITSVAGKVGQVLLNKSDVGLDAVDNTSDEDKPLSYAARTAITDLSTNIETKLDKRSVADIETLESISNPDIGDLVYVEDSNAYYYFSDIYNWARIINDEDLDAKVDKVTGKQLSTNDFSNTYKDILDNPWQDDLTESND